MTATSRIAESARCSGRLNGVTGSFDPKIVPKAQRRLPQVDDLILSLYARGMTTRDIHTPGG
jgi:Transposase, Mutator family